MEAVLDANQPLRIRIAAGDAAGEKMTQGVSDGVTGRAFGALTKAFADASDAARAANHSGISYEVLDAVVQAETACRKASVSITTAEHALAQDEPLRAAVLADAASDRTPLGGPGLAPGSGLQTSVEGLKASLEAGDKARAANHTGIDYDALLAVARAQMLCGKASAPGG